MANTNLRNFGFSSPLGDGLVLVCYVSYVILWKIFVPAWGWVGSYNSRKEGYQRTDFRPRVGMGWFLIKVCMKYGVKLFSSPSGDGLVPV